MTRLLKVPEAALRLNISEKTTWRWSTLGEWTWCGLAGRCGSLKTPIEKLIDDCTIPADQDDQN
jgi:hypothetical protein